MTEKHGLTRRERHFLGLLVEPGATIGLLLFGLNLAMLWRIWKAFH